MATLQHRRGNAAALTSVNPLLAEGEIMIELDCGRLKIGDGVNYWNDLPYVDDKLNWLISLLHQNGTLTTSNFEFLSGYNCPCTSNTGDNSYPENRNDGDGGSI